MFLFFYILLQVFSGSSTQTIVEICQIYIYIIGEQLVG